MDVKIVTIHWEVLSCSTAALRRALVYLPVSSGTNKFNGCFFKDVFNVDCNRSGHHHIRQIEGFYRPISWREWRSFDPLPLPKVTWWWPEPSRSISLADTYKMFQRQGNDGHFRLNLLFGHYFFDKSLTKLLARALSLITFWSVQWWIAHIKRATP